jgi:UDP-N-acetyl-D-glucosamine dehydrogenase
LQIVCNLISYLWFFNLAQAAQAGQFAIPRKERQEFMKVGILGLGYVGIPLALRFAEVGCPVLGFDIDESKVQKLNAGESYIKHIAKSSIATMHASGFSATTDFTKVSEPDVLIICVPTPLTINREPDMSYINGTMEKIAPHLRKGQAIALESTTYPGTTEELLGSVLEREGFTIGEDIFLIYSPEREDPGNKNFTTQSIPKVVGGSTPACLAKGIAIYEQVVDQVVPVPSTQIAEMVKLLENIHRAVNIGLVNEMKIVADRMGIDIFEVINAAATKPFGFTPYYPGPGPGGHCIPIDPFYLTWKAREFGVSTKFIELAGEVNRSMPEWVVGKLISGLNDMGKSIKGSRILALGIAYKKNVDDMRESPSIEVMEILRQWGADVHYSDPHVPVFLNDHGPEFDLKSTDVSPKILASFDCVVMLTAHDQFDLAQIEKHSKLIIDTRGVFEHSSVNVIRA